MPISCEVVRKIKLVFIWYIINSHPPWDVPIHDVCRSLFSVAPKQVQGLLREEVRLGWKYSTDVCIVKSTRIIVIPGIVMYVIKTRKVSRT